MSDWRVGESSLSGSPRATAWYLKKRRADETVGGSVASDRYVSGRRGPSERQVVAQGLGQVGLVGMLLSGTMAAIGTLSSAVRATRPPLGVFGLFAGMTALFGASLVLGRSEKGSQVKLNAQD